MPVRYCDGKDRSSFAVVFDFDGTLIDSKKIKLNSYLQAFVTVFNTGPKLKQPILESSRRTAGANRFIQLQDTLNCLSLTATDEQKEAWSRAYSALNSRAMAHIPEFPSVRNALTELKKKGYHLFAASGILDEEFQRELARRKLKDFFIEAEGGDKPGFLSRLKTRGFEPILFVGDTGFDEKAAGQAGVHFYLIKNDEDFSALPRFLAGSTFKP
jgi:phosphoglycolate phosphatase-like HAD superfamily hydrolase